MKTVLTLVFLSISVMALSQNDTSGVYLSAVDFSNNKLAVPSACPSHENWIKIQNRFITVKINQEKYKFAKSEIFGVRTCRNTYRIQKNAEFKVINNDYFILYSQSISVGSEGSFYEDVFFFSLSPISEIIPLTKEALKMAFSENSKFVTFVDSSFKRDYELGTFNKQLNKYMIVYFYEESIK
ncbi:MAG: hypothetical protein KF856_16025 [Cyclobacteriaceae bacterium]|jgi:hypothetical protein|nr:hypothetical protein [Cyclobacteriaceae bacterium]